jgi:hypothetical protein
LVGPFKYGGPGRLFAAALIAFQLLRRVTPTVKRLEASMDDEEAIRKLIADHFEAMKWDSETVPD